MDKKKLVLLSLTLISLLILEFATAIQVKVPGCIKNCQEKGEICTKSPELNCCNTFSDTNWIALAP